MSKPTDPFAQLATMTDDLVKAENLDLFGGAKPQSDPAKPATAAGHVHNEATQFMGKLHAGGTAANHGGGEGSRGGHIIGHTTSGKPIYASHGDAGHAGFSYEDHRDAAKAHRDVRSKHEETQLVEGAGGSAKVAEEARRSAQHHQQQADAHDAAASAALTDGSQRTAAAERMTRLANKRSKGTAHASAAETHKLAADMHEHAAKVAVGEQKQKHLDAAELHRGEVQAFTHLDGEKKAKEAEAAQPHGWKSDTPAHPGALKDAADAYAKAKAAGRGDVAAHTQAMRAAQKKLGGVTGSWDHATHVQGEYDKRSGEKDYAGSPHRAAPLPKRPKEKTLPTSGGLTQHKHESAHASKVRGLYEKARAKADTATGQTLRGAGSHAKAADAHEEAAKHAETYGDTKAAISHLSQATQHRSKLSTTTAAPAPKPAAEGYEGAKAKAEEASKTARENPTAANHKAAFDAHAHAAAVADKSPGGMAMTMNASRHRDHADGHERSRMAAARQEEIAASPFTAKKQAAVDAAKKYDDERDKAYGEKRGLELPAEAHDALAAHAEASLKATQEAMDHAEKNPHDYGVVSAKGPLANLHRTQQRMVASHREDAKTIRDMDSVAAAYEKKATHKGAKLKEMPDENSGAGSIRSSRSFITNGHVLMHKAAASSGIHAQAQGKSNDADERMMHRALSSFHEGNPRMMAFKKTGKKNTYGHEIYAGANGATRILDKRYATHDTMYAEHDPSKGPLQGATPMGNEPVAPGFAAMPMNADPTTAGGMSAILHAHGTTPVHEAHAASTAAASQGREASTKAQWTKAADAHDAAADKLRAVGEHELADKHASQAGNFRYVANEGKKYLNRGAPEDLVKLAQAGAKAHVDALTEQKIQKGWIVGALVDDLVKNLHNEGALAPTEKSMKTDFQQPKRGKGKKAKVKGGKRSKLAGDPGNPSPGTTTHLNPPQVQGALTKSQQPIVASSTDVWVAAHVDDPDRYRHRPRLNRPRAAPDVYVGNLPARSPNAPAPRLEKSLAAQLAQNAVDLALTQCFAKEVVQANAGTPQGEQLLKSVMPGRMPAWTDEQRRALAPRAPNSVRVVKQAAELLKSLAAADVDAAAGLADLEVSEASLMQRFVDLKLSPENVVIG